jgi:hypothetical protein
VRPTILIPFYQKPGPEGEHRRSLWDRLRPLWENTGFRIVECRDPLASDGPFCVARALNQGIVETPDAEAYVFYGADHLPDVGMLEAIDEVLETQPWARCYSAVRYASEISSKRFIRGGSSLAFVDVYDDCYGILAARADVLKDIGGVDPRFVGWGPGDAAWLCALETLHPVDPDLIRIPGVLSELWHPSSARCASPELIRLYEDEYEAHRGDPVRMRETVSRWARPWE